MGNAANINEVARPAIKAHGRVAIVKHHRRDCFNPGSNKAWQAMLGRIKAANNHAPKMPELTGQPAIDGYFNVHLIFPFVELFTHKLGTIILQTGL